MRVKKRERKGCVQQSDREEEESKGQMWTTHFIFPFTQNIGELAAHHVRGHQEYICAILLLRPPA